MLGAALMLFAASSCTMPDFRIAEGLSNGGSSPSTIPHCANTLLEPDLGESDFDCGGGCAPCQLGQSCNRGADCVSGSCESGVCVSPAPAIGGSGGGGAGGSAGSANGGGGGCDALYGDCGGAPSDGCSGPLGTASDCTHCGEVCTGATPFCSTSGCTDHLDLRVGGPSQHAMKAWNGSGSAAVLSVNHALSQDRGNGRVVVLGVASSGPFEALDVRYDDTPMLMLVDHEHPSRQSRAAVYYLLDADLPAKAGSSEVKVTFDPELMAWGHGGFDVVEVVNAQQAKPTLLTSVEAATTDKPENRGVMLEFDAPGSFVFGVLSARGAKSKATLLQSPPLTENWNERVLTGDDPLVGASAWVLDDDNRSINWTLPNCYNSVVAAVAIQRLSSAPAP